AHLVGVPQRPGDVDALQPRHAVEVLRDQHDHVLGAALTLRAGATKIGDARPAEQRAIEWPPVRDPPNVALELAVVELLVGHPKPIVAQETAGGKGRTPAPNTLGCRLNRTRTAREARRTRPTARRRSRARSRRRPRT